MLTIAELKDFVSTENATFIIRHQTDILKVTPVSDTSKESLSWVKPGKVTGHSALSGTIVCDQAFADILENNDTINLVITNQPKYLFSKIINRYFVQMPKEGVHPTASLHPSCQLGVGCYIGPFTYVGDCKIGDNTVIKGHCHIHDGTVIGHNCVIHAGVVIGGDGFGFSKNEKGEIEKFPHIGNVIIGDDVEIGANTCVDRGALGDTVIKNGVKIDNLVHVAHNVVVEENAYLIANSMIGGSTVIGKGSWIAPSVSLLQQLKIGANSTIGVAAVVTKNIPEGETWAGSPAKPLADFVALQQKLKKL